MRETENRNLKAARTQANYDKQCQYHLEPCACENKSHHGNATVSLHAIACFLH